tara:strand:+ start:4031 stop:4273 length:243 start_codon:yes stop_codon:yes gene_type:complete
MINTIIVLFTITYTAYYYHRRQRTIKKNVEASIRNRRVWLAGIKEKVAQSSKTGYINNMVKIKLVYNPDTNEWDKLRELE